MVIKMDRAYVICHMAVSLDGKIDGDFHEAEKSEKAGAYYYDVIFDLGSSMAGGHVTTRMYSPQPEVDYEKYKGVDVPEGDYIVQNAQGHYCLVYDREGRCTWEAPADCEAGCVHEEVAKRISNVRFIRTDLESVNPMMCLHSILRAVPF